MKDSGYIYSADLGHDVRLINHELAQTEELMSICIMMEGIKKKKKNCGRLKRKSGLSLCVL